MIYSGVRLAIPVPRSLAEMKTSSQISSAYMGAIGKTGISVALDDIFFDEEDEEEI